MRTRRLMWRTSVVLGITGLCSLGHFAYAQVPKLIRYQGTLVDANNVPIEGAVDLTFRLYDAATGGTVLWTETQTGVPVSRGVFNVLLGQVAPLTLPFDKDYWLTTQVNTDTEMSPRQRLTSVPYAYRAKVAEQLAEQPAGFAVDTAGTLANGLIAYWKLEEGSGSRADSKGTNALTDTNTVTQAAGKQGQAAKLTAANAEYLSIADNADLSTGDVDFTIAAWVYLDTHNVERPIIEKTANANDVLEYLLTAQVDVFTFGVRGGGTYHQVTTSPTGGIQNGTWYFLVAWHDSVNDVIKIQVNDGSPAQVAHSAGVGDTTASVRIGTDAFSNFMDGRIDEVGFWKRVLTAGERADLYNAGNGNTYLPGGFYAESALTGKRYRVLTEEVL